MVHQITILVTRLLTRPRLISLRLLDRSLAVLLFARRVHIRIRRVNVVTARVPLPIHVEQEVVLVIGADPGRPLTWSAHLQLPLLNGHLLYLVRVLVDTRRRELYAVEVLALTFRRGYRVFFE